MKRILSIVLLLVLFSFGPACSPATADFQDPDAPEIASYAIDVTLNVDTHRLEGRETITYHNATREPIPDLVFHLYLNAFKDNTTLFMSDSGGQYRGGVLNESTNGWVEVTSLRIQGGAPLRLELLEDGTLARAALSQPIKPGQSLVVELAFRAQLPQVIARTGWVLDSQGDPFFMVAQWFPKLGVWQEDGWNAYPFYNNAEFFADFGTYDVRVTLPSGFITGATGLPVETIRNNDGTQTIEYHAEDVIDFAWTASPNFQSATRTVQVPGGEETEILYLYMPEHEWTVEQTLNSAEYTVEYLSEWYGPYPYDRLTLLDVPSTGAEAGGMEYPTMVAVGAHYGGPEQSGNGWNQGIELVTVHEVAHQWWQSMVAFNEAEEPWLDEGFTDYSTTRVMAAEYGLEVEDMTETSFNARYLDGRRGAFLNNPDQPLYATAWELRGTDYLIAAYAKPNLALMTLERVLGEETMLEIMQAFFQRYQFAHPTTEDFRAVVEEVAEAAVTGSEQVDWFFDGLVYGDDTVDFEAVGITAQSITVERKGDLEVPVQIEVTFADGSTQLLDWPADSEREIFTFDGPAQVQSFVIDPQRALFIELDWRDNNLARQVTAPANPPQNRKPEAPVTQDWNGLAPDVAVYDIDVRLNVDERTLEGLQTLRYVNTTGRSMPDLVLHLYLNAFENEETYFMREGGPQHRGFSWDPEERGWIEVSGLRLMDGTELALELLEDGTLARAELPAPVQPGEALELELAFTARLPKVFARTGWALDDQGEPFFMVGQWFPKPGVWTEEGWNAYPFHASSEFFADFGAYDVRITLPEGWVTGGTGMPGETAQNGDGTQTVAYHAEDVIDFAWTASPNFEEESRRVGETEIRYLYLPEHAASVQRALDAAEAAVAHFSAWYGPYPYERLTVVDVPNDGQGAGGMEYPTLITAGTLDVTGLGLNLGAAGTERMLEMVITHEVGHQWWQSMVAFNEAEEPWLDEGITDYSSVRSMSESYGLTTSMLNVGGFQVGYLDLRRMEYVSSPNVPMYGAAWEFSGIEYGVASYSKPALSLLTLERVLGEETMLELMGTFFERYAFAHPTTEDFRAVAEEVAGAEQVAWFFDGMVYGDASVNYTAQSIEEHAIIVAREGSLALPTEIEVTFEGGQKRIVNWDGEPDQGSAQTFTFPDDPPVTGFTIDPARKLVVELVWSDNGLRRDPDAISWLTLFTRLMFRVQDWLLTLGGI